MKNLQTLTNLKTITLGMGRLSGRTLFLFCAMQFTLQVTASRAQADEFPVNCLTTPTPTPMAFVGPTPNQTLCTPTPTAYPSLVEEIPINFQNPNPRQARVGRVSC